MDANSKRKPVVVRYATKIFALVAGVSFALPRAAEASGGEWLPVFYAVVLYQLILPPILLLKPQSMRGRRLIGFVIYLLPISVFWIFLFLPMAELLKTDFSRVTANAVFLFVALFGPWLIVLVIYAVLKRATLLAQKKSDNSEQGKGKEEKRKQAELRPIP